MLKYWVQFLLAINGQAAAIDKPMPIEGVSKNYMNGGFRLEPPSMAEFCDQWHDVHINFLGVC